MNYVGVAGALGIAASAQAAGLAADNLLCVLYFSFIFQLARGLPPDPPAAPSDHAGSDGSGEVIRDRKGIQVCPLGYPGQEGHPGVPPRLSGTGRASRCAPTQHVRPRTRNLFCDCWPFALTQN